MHLKTKIILIIAILAISLAVILALKVSSFDEKNISPRGVLVGRIEFYGY